MSEELVQINNTGMVVAQKSSALSKLFQVKPATLDLVAKASRQQDAIPGKLRVVQTGEHFDSIRAVILFEPTQNRKKYLKGQYSKDALDCFSTDAIQPHRLARNPPSLYCASCPSGDLMWVKYREAKNKGLSGDALSALIPECKSSWNMLIADRATKLPYWLAVRGTSIKPFEVSMQSIARIFAMLMANARAEIKAGKNVTLPQSVSDVIWKISFTLGVDQPIRGGQYVLSFKDFRVMSAEDQAEFGAIYQDFLQRRTQGAVQSQDVADAEEEASLVTEATPIKTAEVLNQIEI